MNINDLYNQSGSNFVSKAFPITPINIETTHFIEQRKIVVWILKNKTIVFDSYSKAIDYAIMLRPTDDPELDVITVEWEEKGIIKTGWVIKYTTKIFQYQRHAYDECFAENHFMVQPVLLRAEIF